MQQRSLNLTATLAKLSADSHLHFNRSTKTDSDPDPESNRQLCYKSQRYVKRSAAEGYVQGKDSRLRSPPCFCAARKLGHATLYVSIVAGGVTQPRSPVGPAQLTKAEWGPSENSDSLLCEGLEGLSGAADSEGELYGLTQEETTTVLTTKLLTGPRTFPLSKQKSWRLTL